MVKRAGVSAEGGGPSRVATGRRAAVLLALAAALAGASGFPSATAGGAEPAPPGHLFDRENLVAWCIVPFDGKKRGPEERAAMLERLGFKHFAYDWRAEHVPTFDAEVEALKRHHVALDAFWVSPGVLNRESRLILDLLRRHGLKAQLWVLLDLGPDRVTGQEQERRVEAAAAQLQPLAAEAAKVGSTLGLYNHGGWFGEPENQIAVIERLKARGQTNLGIVYNLHHGHDHLERLPELLARMKPYLLAVNLNGTDRGGDRVGRKILPLGQGALDLQVLRTVRDSGYRGPIGILGHTDDDAEQRLRDNLDGLDWLVPQLDGKPPGPRPTPRTPVPPPPAGAPGTSTTAADAPPFDPALVSRLVREARSQGNPRHGAEVFASTRFACMTCHRVGGQGGAVGPELTNVGACLKPEEVVESLLWPRRQVKPGYETLAVMTRDGRLLRGYREGETPEALVLRDPSSGERVRLAKAEVEATRDEGSMMPEALTTAMSAVERRDLIRFLLDLGRPGGPAVEGLGHVAHAPAEFAFDRAPLHPEQWPGRTHPVNRDRVYDFYAKEAEAFLDRPGVPLLPQFPGLDGGREGHWGNQDETTWADDRWNRTDLGSVLCGVFRGAGVTVPKGVCVRLGDRGEMAACFNPETLRFEALWRGGFVRFSPTRHGFLDGLILDGTPLPRPDDTGPEAPFVYHGFYRHGRRVIFSYSVGGVEMLDAPWVEDGRFTRVVGPAKGHPLAGLTRGGPPRWPQVLTTRGTPGRGGPYVVDTIAPPFQNPWNALLFFGGHDFLPDGTALLCTMQGDVWSVDGLDERLDRVRWRRFAAGLHQALGLVVSGGKAHVLGRDQITRLHDLDGDGEADFYECVSNAYKTSPAGHDFVCGLERDGAGRFYTASGPQGLVRISADGRSVETIADGFRNPDGLGLGPDGAITVPNSEGEWVPASMVCEVGPGTFFGARGPRGRKPPDLPLVYLPRGLDNSSGGQVFVRSDRFGPLDGQCLHFSFGAGAWFLLLRERVDGQPQGAAVPLPGEFRSGAHRGRFNPKDGQLYVSGMGGWGTYTVDDGSFQRVRYTGGPVQLPTASHAHQNGILLTSSRPLDPAVAGRADRQFAQAWNYRYGRGYGSSEWSARHPGVTGHDRLVIRSAHVLEDGRSLFLEVPDLQPVNQLHLHLRPDGGAPVDLFLTVHRLAAPFTGFPGYRPEPKTVAAHPILADMAALNARPAANPWVKKIPGERPVAIEAGKNLSYSVRTLDVRAGEPIRLTFSNPDVVPHNWALIRPGALSRFGDLVNKIVAEPDAALRQYVPRSEDLLVYTDVVGPGEQFTISFRAPTEPGRYPYLCTFPGHWMVMNGEMRVGPADPGPPARRR
jgi:putative heme-binding domain-containing protein